MQAEHITVSSRAGSRPIGCGMADLVAAWEASERRVEERRDTVSQWPEPPATIPTLRLNGRTAALSRNTIS